MGYYSKPGWVYACEAVSTDMVKIGFTSKSVARRLTILQTGSPIELRTIWSVPGTLALEDRLHIHFRERRGEWGEWFNFAGVDAAEELEKAAPGGVMPPRELPQPPKPLVPPATEDEIERARRARHRAWIMGAACG